MYYARPGSRKDAGEIKADQRLQVLMDRNTEGALRSEERERSDTLE
jgi:hypothetical protein